MRVFRYNMSRRVHDGDGRRRKKITKRVVEFRTVASSPGTVAARILLDIPRVACECGHLNAGRVNHAEWPRESGSCGKGRDRGGNGGEREARMGEEENS